MATKNKQPSNKTSDDKKFASKATIIVAVIGLAGTLVAAYFGFGFNVKVEGSNGVVIVGPGANPGDIQVNPQAPQPTKDVNLYNVQIEGQESNVIVAYNKAREVLWQDELDTKVQKVKYVDINKDGYLEVIAGTIESGKNSSGKPGWLYIYDYTGNKLFAQDMWKSSIYWGGSKPKGNIVDLDVNDINNDGIQEVVILVQDIYWYAARLSVLQINGSSLVEVGEYWNPGLLRNFYMADVNNDKIMEIVCVGENNDLQNEFGFTGNVFVAILFEGNKISGEAPPEYGNEAKGSQVWFAYLLPPSAWITEVDFDDFNNDSMAEIQVTFSDSCSYYLDYNGNVVGYGHGTNCNGNTELKILR